MIVIFGLLSLIQIFIIPGLFVIKFAKFSNPLINFLAIIAISPIANYLLVFFLTSINLYDQSIVLSIFLLETIVLFILYLPELNRNVIDILSSINFKEFFAEYFLPASNRETWKKHLSTIILTIAFLFASFCVAYYFVKYGMQFNSIFTKWDAVFSWDLWAVQWYNGIFPPHTYHYPQLMPANYSLSYMFVGNENVKFFAKVFANYLEIFVVLAIFFAGLVTKKSGFFWGTIITAWLQLQLGSNGDGYVDTAVAFWGLLPFLFLYFSCFDKENLRKYLFFGAIFAAGSMVVKQAGGWIVITYSLALFIMYWKKEQQLLRSILWKILLIYSIIIIPWYVFAEWGIATGINKSEIATTIKLGSIGMTWLETLQNSIMIFINKLANDTVTGSLLFIFIFLTSALSKDKFWKYVYFVVAVPFFIIWVFYFCYDTRNANLILPIIGIASGFGIQNIILDVKYPIIFEKIIERLINNIITLFLNIGKFTKNFVSKIRFIYLLPLVILLLLLPIKYSNEYLIEKSINLQKGIGNPTINAALYDYFDENGYEGNIISDYRWISRMPEISQYYVVRNILGEKTIEQLENESNSYLFVDPTSLSEDVNIYIDTKIKENRIETILEIEDLYLYKVCYEVCQ